MEDDLFDLHSSELGKKTQYIQSYCPQILYSIPRITKRAKLGLDINNPIFQGIDVWNAYEISWLNHQGLPQVRIGRFYFDANSEFMIESKSLKLYLNSFNNMTFKDHNTLLQLITNDLSNLVKTPVKVEFFDVNSHFYFTQIEDAICIDDNSISIKQHDDVEPSYLRKNSDKLVEEKLYTNLFRSNCLVTNQPDWASVFIEYNGYKISHTDLLRYLISYRNHNGFHEHCVERIFVDMNNIFMPSYLSVFGMYTRRGGIDISPFRSTFRSTSRPAVESILDAAEMQSFFKLHRTTRQ